MNRTSLKTRFTFAAPLLQRLAGFWSWWITELLGILPERLRTAILPGVERLYLKLDGQQVIVGQGVSETYREVGRYPLAATELPPGQAQGVEDLSGRTREVVLCLPADKVLVKTLTLPLAAEENLREVLGFEMDRQTPFGPGQVYYDYLLSARNPKQHTLTLDLLVTPRRFLDDLLARLQGIGFQPQQVTLCLEETGQPRPINLLPAELTQRRPDMSRRLNLALGLLAVVLLLGTIALPLVNKLRVIQALEARTELVAGKAEVIRRLRDEVERLGTGSGFLVEKRQATPLVLSIVNELTRILPDDTWINQLDIRGQEIQIQGQSASAAALIPLIESSGSLHNARFRSPVTKMPGLNDERFHLSAEVATGPAP